MNRNPSDTAPMPQVWIQDGKRITMTTCGNRVTYVEVCLKTGKVETKTFVKA